MFISTNKASLALMINTWYGKQNMSSYKDFYVQNHLTEAVAYTYIEKTRFLRKPTQIIASIVIEYKNFL